MRFPLRTKIALLTATCSAVPLLVVGWLLIDVNAREVESSSQAMQIALVERVASEVDDELARGHRALDAIGAALTDGALEDDARVALALRVMDTHGGFDVIAIHDAQGALIDRLRDPRSEPAAMPERLEPPLRARAEHTGLAITDATAGPTVLLVVPLRAGGDVTGYLAAPLSFARVQRLVEQLSSAQLASDEGSVFVADDDGRVLAHPDRTRILARTPSFDAASAAMPRSEERRIGDRSMITTSVGLEGAPWAAVAEIPRDVVYASLDRMRTIVIATIVATLLAAFLAAFVFARWITRPIGALVELTKRLAAREFSARATIDTKDELAVLGGALNDAASELERSEERAREEMAIRADLRRYLPAELVDAIVRREQSMELGGRRLPITVLFADVVAFTPLSERLPPEQVVALLNELFTLLTEAVFRNGGTVDKFVGDCVMALWGAPAPAPDHAQRALLAAQDMLRFLESANEGWRERFGVDVQLAIGVNSGEAVVGNVGSQTRMEYTAIGDVVNVAARLETVARPQQILISRTTADAVEAEFELVPVGSREVPGRSAAIELFEVRW